MNFPEVKEVAAIGVPDDIKGFKVKLFIAWNNPNTILKEEFIRTTIKENISLYAEPADIVILKSLPKTIIGKTNILELEKM